MPGASTPRRARTFFPAIHADLRAHHRTAVRTPVRVGASGHGGGARATIARGGPRGSGPIQRDDDTACHRPHGDSVRAHRAGRCSGAQRAADHRGACRGSRAGDQRGCAAASGGAHRRGSARGGWRSRGPRERNDRRRVAHPSSCTALHDGGRAHDGGGGGVTRTGGLVASIRATGSCQHESSRDRQCRRVQPR